MHWEDYMIQPMESMYGSPWHIPSKHFVILVMLILWLEEKTEDTNNIGV